MSQPFDADHPEQAAYDQTCSIWLTAATSDREKRAYRDGHHKGWNNALNGLEEICAALRAAMAEKRTRSHTCPVCAASMVESDEALLRQALEALEMSSGDLDGLSEKMFKGPKKAKPGSTSWHVARAVAALRERLDA